MKYPDDDFLSDLEPIYDLFSTFQGPLTSEDIARIERGINILVADLFQNRSAEEIEEELEAPLSEKLDAYIGIADKLAEQFGDNPEYKEAKQLPQLMRKLLQMVNEYDHRLN